MKISTSMSLKLLAAVSLTATSMTAYTQQATETTKTTEKASGLETVIVTANRVTPTSLPTQIPTTMEGVTREELMKTINATDSEDALKYLPSLLVRKRYIGDYNHAVLSSRASGTGNSARSAVYADGILLSNYLGNGAAFAPRWMMVTPEEIERVDVMYGPFSAAYHGNSVGAVVDYVTRMPSEFEAHVKASYISQPFDMYNTDSTFKAHQHSASIGDRIGKFSWWVNLNQTKSHGQPQTFPNKTVSSGTVGTTGTPVTGAVLGNDRFNNPWYLIGTATEYTTIQDHGKIKLAYDITPDIRASYLVGYWHNESENRPDSYLRDAAGNTIYSGSVNIDGRAFTVAASDYGQSNEDLTHMMHGISIKSNTDGVWDWEVAASLYDLDEDELRAATTALPAAATGGAGTLTDQDGTGWKTLALKGIWRPSGMNGDHIADFGFQSDNYDLRILRSTLTNWISGSPVTVSTDVGGKTRTQSIYAQDAWTFAPRWKTVLGVRVEQWQASDGYTINGALNTPYESRKQTFVSPKAALAYEVSDTTALKASVGRAVRMPTVSELYGSTNTVSSVFINDPNVKPEQSWTGELSVEQALGAAQLRVTGFYEVVRNSLFSDRRVFNNVTTNRVVNVGKLATPGVEISLLSNDVFIQGLDVSGSVTYADSRIKRNDGYVNASGVLSDDTIGKYQPRVPIWRATALVNYNVTEKLNVALGARFSGKQFSTLDNSDINGFAFQGSSKYFTADLRVRYQFAEQWAAALGIENLNNYEYWNFHPYPQRNYTAELRWDW